LHRVQIFELEPIAAGARSKQTGRMTPVCLKKSVDVKDIENTDYEWRY